MAQGGSSSRTQTPEPSNNAITRVLQLNESLFELHKPKGRPSMVVLFFHGFQNGNYENAHISTWKTEHGREDGSSTWLQTWLVDDDQHPDAHILSVAYNASLMKSKKEGSFDLYIIGENIISDLLEANIAQGPRCPIVLVGHSFGGLVVKELCVQAHKRGSMGSSKHKNFLENIKGAFFYSTPHHGISGEISEYFVSKTNQPLLNYVKVLSTSAARLHEDFDKVRKQCAWQSAGVGEGLPTHLNLLKTQIIVPEGSSRYGDTFAMVPEADHLSICRPILKISRPFKSLSSFLHGVCVMWKDADLQPIPTRIFDIDDLYVPIVEVQNAVIAAIEKLDGPRIVLLHGGVGKGKSTLARYVHMIYQNRKEVFQYVLLVDCAGSSKLDPSNKQYENLRRLSPASLTTNPEKERSDFKLRIAKSLHEFFLSGSKILIILDGVSDRRFIDEMLKASQGGTQVKYLVTSQYPNLCHSCRNYSFPVYMCDPKHDEAKTILATLVGLKDNEIPQKLQRIADQMITATGGNPLALASLASNFVNNQDKTDVRARNEAYKALCQILRDPEKILVLGGTSDDTPPRSLWAAMKLCIDYLESRDAKDILFLMYACEGESVPEEVLRIMHATAKTSGGMFSKSIAELWSRDLLKASTNTIAAKLNFDSKHQISSKSWSMLTTLKLYIDQRMASDQEMRSLFSFLQGEGEIKASSSVKHERGSEAEPMVNGKNKVAIALCALYFDGDHTDKVVKEAATWACGASHMNDWNATIKERRRKAIEPLIWLLDQTEEDDPTWRESHLQCLRQVFLRYICFSELDDSNICILLKLTSCPSAQLAMLVALADILDIEEIPLLKSDSLTFLQPLAHILKSNADLNSNIQVAAWEALDKVTQKSTRERQSDSIVTSTPDLLTTLQRSLQDSDARATKAALILARLSYAGYEIGNHILTENGAGLLRSLVKALSKDHNPKFQQRAVQAMANLAAGGESVKLRILGADGALAGLVKCLSNDQNPEVQEHAARALTNLAFGQETLKLRVLGEDGALEGLVGALSKDGNPELQKESAGALCNLAAGGEFVKLRILGADGALAGLVKCLSNDQNPKVQEYAAWTLNNLAVGQETLKLKVLGEDGALEGLVGALSKDGNPELQKQSAMAMVNLAAGGESVKLRILGADGALAGLVKCLSNDQNPGVQEHAARALTNLAFGQETLKLRVLGEDGALEGLVGALSKDGNPELQKQSAWALCNLAAGGESVKLRILGADGALAGLVKCLSDDQNPEVQEYAAWTLKYLAFGQETLKLKVLGEDGALEGLVGALSKDGNPELQKQSAWALCNLAAGGESVKLRILGADGALAGLVKCLSNDQNPKVQEYAAWTLNNLAFGQETLKLKVLGEDGALEGLVGALSKDGNPELQKQSAMALGNLAAGGDSIKLTIVNKEGAIAGLLRAYSEVNKPLLQKYAALALVKLAHTLDPSIKIKARSEVVWLAALTKSAAMGENEFRKEAQLALKNLEVDKRYGLKFWQKYL